MPCNQIRYVGIELQVKFYDILKTALEADGWSVNEYNGTLFARRGADRVEIANGKALVRETTPGKGEGHAEVVAREILQAYGRQCAKVASKRFGYKLTQDKKDRNYFKVTQ